MKKLSKILGRVFVGALAAGLTPYRFKMEKESGSYELSSLLLSVKKTAGEERDRYTFELLPLLGGGGKSAETGEAPAEAAAEEAAPEEASVEAASASEPV